MSGRGSESTSRGPQCHHLPHCHLDVLPDLSSWSPWALWRFPLLQDRIHSPLGPRGPSREPRLPLPVGSRPTVRLPGPRAASSLPSVWPRLVLCSESVQTPSLLAPQAHLTSLLVFLPTSCLPPCLPRLLFSAVYMMYLFLYKFVIYTGASAFPG